MDNGPTLFKPLFVRLKRNYNNSVRLFAILLNTRRSTRNRTRWKLPQRTWKFCGFMLWFELNNCFCWVLQSSTKVIVKEFERGCIACRFSKAANIHREKPRKCMDEDEAIFQRHFQVICLFRTIYCFQEAETAKRASCWNDFWLELRRLWLLLS